MKDLQWFPAIPEPPAASTLPVLASAVAGAAVGGWLFARGHRALAIVVWAITIAIALGWRFQSIRRPLLRAARWLGAIAGRIAILAVLWPFYVLIFGGARLVLSMARVDLLGLRLQRDGRSYWQPAPPERERARYYQRLFTVAPVRRESRWRARTAGFLAFVLLLAGTSEVILRSMGFGHPIVYRLDPLVGYYPAPNQDVHRYGGNIHINTFGMRSPDITAAKPTGVFRILMLGDSTLYGGSYLDQSQIYATRLAELLNQARSALPDSPRQVQVLCMGVNAWGPQHELAYVKEFGLFQADLVMVMGPPSDAYRARYGIALLPFYAEGRRPHWAWQEFWDHLLWEYKLRSTGAAERAEASEQTGDVLADGVAAWLGIAARAQSQGVGVDFELLPNEEEARMGRASESTQRVLDALLPALDRRGVAYSYPLALFQSKLDVAKLYHDGVHLDTSGHRIYALYLRDRVRELTSAK